MEEETRRHTVCVYHDRMENLPDRVLLLEEGAKSTVRELVQVAEQFKQIGGKFAEVATKWETVKDTFITIYVSKEEFKLVRNIVFGMVGVICMAFITALVAVVWKK